MPGRILHLLSQRPSLTGSGVTLDAVVRLAGRAGWHQQVLVGVPAGEASPVPGGLPPRDIHRILFAGRGGKPDLPYLVPGMSDVMPYASSIWSRLSAESLAAYRGIWRDRLRQVVESFQPDLIHSNHIWILSALVKDIDATVPVVATCHATGLRQMELCPHLREEVVRGCRRIERFCVLREDHRKQLAITLGIPPARITVTGAGYRNDLFHPASRTGPGGGELLYVGKYSAAKGLPWLLDAVELLSADRPGLRLHVAGDGAGDEAEQLRSRMDAMAPVVVRHGQPDQSALADLMRRCDVCVLPSFYEGVPLVLVEAAACGCRIVSTALPGIVERIRPCLGGRMDLVPVPGLTEVDRPVAADLPRFVADLTGALRKALATEPVQTIPDLEHFTWHAVFGRVEGIWRELT